MQNPFAIHSPRRVAETHATRCRGIESVPVQAVREPESRSWNGSASEPNSPVILQPAPHGQGRCLPVERGPFATMSVMAVLLATKEAPDAGQWLLGSVHE